MKANDAVVGLALVVFAGAMMFYASGFPSPQPGRPGPALFPIALGVLFAVSGLILFASGIRAGGRLLSRQPWTHDRRKVFGAAAVVISVLVYILAADTIGFLPLAALLPFVLMKLAGVSTRVAGPTAVLCALLIHTLFAKFLLVPLPWGILETFAW